MSPIVVSTLKTWRGFSLNDEKDNFENVAYEIISKQDEGALSKKKLGESCQEFKKNTTEDILKLVSPLFNSFQNENNKLNQRCTFAENAYMKVCHKIIEVVDPIPALEYCIELEKKAGKVTDLELENINLRETLKEYNEEFKEVRNQDVTIKSLKDKLKSYEENMDENLQSKTVELENKLLSQFSEKEQILIETQSTSMRRLQDAEAKVLSLQKTLEQTQSELFEYKNKAEEYAEAHSDEFKVLIKDLDRMTQRTILDEKEIADLTQQLAASQESALNMAPSNTENIEKSSLEAELNLKTSEISQLVDDVKTLQSSMQVLRKENKSKMEIMGLELDKKAEQINDLKASLDRQVDYNEIKRELNIIKSVEFGVPQYADTNSDDEQSIKSLESLLIEKSKSLQNENTVLKQANLDLTKHVSEANQEVSSLRNLSLEQKNLILQLESDVSSMQSFSSIYRGEGEGCVSVPELVAEAVKGTEHPGGSGHSLLSDRDSLDGHSSVGRAMSVSSVVATENMQTSADSLLPIIKAQKDRFKLKNDELDSVLTLKKQEMILLHNEVESLRTDNVKLYEKIRFLQSYRGKQEQLVSPKQSASIAETRYSGQYEESLDPFVSFSRSERLRKYGALTPFDKISLYFGRFILGNKTARLFTCIYTFLVHGMIFLVLYKLANTESCKREESSDCAQRYAEHMQGVHGQNDFHG